MLILQHLSSLLLIHELEKVQFSLQKICFLNTRIFFSFSLLRLTPSQLSYTLLVYTFQLQQTGKTLASRLHLATIDRFHAGHSRESILSSEEISTLEHFKTKTQYTQYKVCFVSQFDTNESFTGKKLDENYSINFFKFEVPQISISGEEQQPQQRRRGNI